jgi:preprotein translocase subunit SecY
VLLLGSLLLLVLSGVRTSIGRKIDSIEISSLQSAYKTAQDVTEKIRDSSGDLYNTLKAIVTGIMILTAIVCVFCIIYLFSRRRFIEITSMRGTYRVVVQRGDRELPRIVSQLQARIARR